MTFSFGDEDVGVVTLGLVSSEIPADSVFKVESGKPITWIVRLKFIIIYRSNVGLASDLSPKGQCSFTSGASVQTIDFALDSSDVALRVVCELSFEFANRSLVLLDVEQVGLLFDEVKRQDTVPESWKTWAS